MQDEKDRDMRSEEQDFDQESPDVEGHMHPDGPEIPRAEDDPATQAEGSKGGEDFSQSADLARQ